MKKIREELDILEEQELIEDLKDCKRIQKIMSKNGYQATLRECEELWYRYSESMCASWILMKYYTDDEIFSNIKYYIKEYTTN